MAETSVTKRLHRDGLNALEGIDVWSDVPHGADIRIGYVDTPGVVVRLTDVSEAVLDSRGYPVVTNVEYGLESSQSSERRIGIADRHVLLGESYATYRNLGKAAELSVALVERIQY